MLDRPEIAFFGSSLLSAYWNGAATYYRGIISALNAIGYKTTFFEPDAYDRQRHLDIAPPDWAQVVVYKGEDGLSKSLEQAKKYGLVIKASGVGVYDDILEKEIAALGSSSRMVAFWDVDAPATLQRISLDASDYFRPLIPKYDMVFTYGGGHPVVTAYKSFGARDCFPIYNALDPSTHYPEPVREEFACRLCFLGNRLPDRETRVEEFFLKPASALPQYPFILGGNGWHNKPVPPNVKLLGHVYTKDHNALNSSSMAVLNIERQSMAENGFSPPTRVFEAAGAAACLITDQWEGIGMFLEPGREALTASNGDEVAQIVSSLTQQEARKIGQAARKRVLSEHTYRHRALQFDAIVRAR
ncbi:MAG: glycosyltransferase [Actinomycetota bacterium]|nr:glycosyltransferase [Actinomycetota bacterium]